MREGDTDLLVQAGANLACDFVIHQPRQHRFHHPAQKILSALLPNVLGKCHAVVGHRLLLGQVVTRNLNLTEVLDDGGQRHLRTELHHFRGHYLPVRWLRSPDFVFMRWMK